MKRLVCMLIACCMNAFLAYAAGTISLNNVAYRLDTLADYQAGPGSRYIQVRMTRQSDGGGRLDAYFLKVDTHNEYISIQEELGTDKLVGTERPSTLAKRKTTPTKVYFGGTNGDFFVTQGDVGRPTGLTIQNGEYAYTGGTSRRAGGVDSNNHPVLCSSLSFSAKIMTKDLDTLKVKHVNYNRLEDELVLYNQHNAATTGTNQYGTELRVRLVEGNTWKTNGTMLLVVEEKEVNVGSMAIPAGKAVLSVHGTMSTALQKIAVGDTVKLKMTLKVNGVATNMKECVGGDTYALIVHDGEVEQSNFWDENHPRTGFGGTQTGDTAIFCVVDGRGFSQGCTTKVLGEIMRYHGAYNAVNWDGGGSSCMYIRPFGQVNVGSDGSERACGNSMFAVANLPEEDLTIAEIQPMQKRWALPKYGAIKPRFFGYNQYGVLVDTDVRGVQLSVNDDLGYTIGDSTFVMINGAGVVTATWNGLTTTIAVKEEDEAVAYFRLDTVLVNQYKHYQVETQATIGLQTLQLLPEAFTWTSANAETASVDAHGVIRGISNGCTVVGNDKMEDEIVVNVELAPAYEYLWETFLDADKWVVDGTSSFNPVLTQTEQGIADLQFTYKKTRGPYVQLEHVQPLYSLPDSLVLHLNTDVKIDQIVMGFHVNNSLQALTATLRDIPVGEETNLAIALSDLESVADFRNFPFWLEYLKFSISTGAENTAGDKHIQMRGISLIYKDFVETGVANPETQTSTLRVMPNPVTDEVCIEGATEVINLYDMQGRLLLSEMPENASKTLNLGYLMTGQYILSSGHEIVQIMKK